MAPTYKNIAGTMSPEFSIGKGLARVGLRTHNSALEFRNYGAEWTPVGQNLAPVKVAVTSDTKVDGTYDNKLITNAGAQTNVVIELPSRAVLGDGFRLSLATRVGALASFGSLAIDDFDASHKASWRFGAGALTVDSKGTNTLTNNGTVAESTSGKFGNCASMSGSNYFSIASNAAIAYSGNEFLISVWLKPSSLSAERYVLGMGNHYLLRQNSDDTIYTNIYNSGGTSKEMTSTTTLSTTAWTHVLFGLVDGYTRLFINGSAEGTPLECTGAYASTNTLYLGGYSSGEYAGLFDHLDLWNDMTITAAEAASMGAAIWNDGQGRAMGSNAKVELRPYPADRLPHTIEAGSSLLSSNIDDYLELRATDEGYIFTSLRPEGNWVDMLNAPDLVTESVIVSTPEGAMTGETVQHTITAEDNPEYTGTIAWSPDDETFQASTVYTATVTLTAVAGKTFVGLPADFFTMNGISGTSAANSGVVTIVFPETESGSVSYTVAGAGTAAYNKTDWEDTGIVLNGKPSYMSKGTVQQEIICWSTAQELGSAWVMEFAQPACLVFTSSYNTLARVADANGHSRWYAMTSQYNDIHMEWSVTNSRWEITLDYSCSEGEAGQAINYHPSATGFWPPQSGWNVTEGIALMEFGWGLYINDSTADAIPTSGWYVGSYGEPPAPTVTQN